MAQHSTKLLSKRELADHVYELRFEKPEGFTYQAGQFVQFLIPNGEKKTPRSYSLSSTPTDDYIEFCVKFLENGLASTHFAHMNDGDELEMDGPQGRFVCNEHAVHHVFVATGAGIAPIMGMIRDELENNDWKNDIDLVFGVRSQKDIIWLDKLQEIKDTYPNFKYHVTLSRPDENWNGLEGRVTDHLESYTPDCHFYLCGSAAMVMDVRKIMKEQGVDTKNMHFEIF